MGSFVGNFGGFCDWDGKSGLSGNQKPEMEGCGFRISEEALGVAGIDRGRGVSYNHGSQPATDGPPNLAPANPPLVDDREPKPAAPFGCANENSSPIS